MVTSWMASYFDEGEAFSIVKPLANPQGTMKAEIRFTAVCKLGSHVLYLTGKWPFLLTSSVIMDKQCNNGLCITGSRSRHASCTICVKSA